MAKGKAKSSYLKKAKQFATGKSQQFKADKQSITQTASRQDDDLNSCQQFTVIDSSSDHNHHTAINTAVVGLTNLGNTCFFNSSVQLLLACGPLQQMLLQPDHHIAKGPLGYGLKQAALFADGRKPAAKSSATYNPQSLLSAVCCYAPVFKGKQQHDSHELMRMLLDGLQTQEARFNDLSKRGAKGSSSDTADVPAADAPAAAAAAQPANGGTSLPNETAGSSRSSSDVSAHSSSSSSSSESVAGSDIAETGADKADSSSTSSSSSSQDMMPSKKAVITAGNSFVALVNADPDEYSSSGDSTADHSSSSSSSSEAPRQQQQTAAAVVQDPGSEGKLAAAPVDIVEAAAAETLQHADASACAGCEQEQDVPSSQMHVSRQHCEMCNAPLPTALHHHHQQQHQELEQQQQQGHAQQRQQQGGNQLARKSLLPPDPPKSAGSTSVDAVFGGVLVSTIGCTACGHVSVSYEPFLDLSLPIPSPEAGGGSLTRKGSLLSRLASRSSGGGKSNKAAAAAAAAKQSDAAAVGEEYEGASIDAAPPDAAAAAAMETEQQDDGAVGRASAALAAALASGKKLSHKERRKLQQAAQKEAKEQKKLARLAAKKQQQQQQQDASDDTDSAGHADPASAAGAAAGASPKGIMGLGRTSAIDADSSRGSSSSPVDPPQQQQQRDGASVPPSPGPVRAVADSDGDSAASTWTDLGHMAASPPTSAVGCFGAGMHSVYGLRDLTSPKPPGPVGSNNSSGSTTPGFKPIHRRFSSLGSLSGFSALGGKGGLTSLFGGWQGRTSKDGAAADTAAAAGQGGSSSSGQGGSIHVTPPPRPASALGFTTASAAAAAELSSRPLAPLPELFQRRAGRAATTTAVGSGLAQGVAGSGSSDGELLSPARVAGGSNVMSHGLWRAGSGGSVSSSSTAGDSSCQGITGNGTGDAAAAAAAWQCNAVQQQAGEGVSVSSTHGNSSSSSSGAKQCAAPTIPEECAVVMTPSMVLTDSQRQQLQLQLQEGACWDSVRSSGSCAAAADDVGAQQQQRQQWEDAASPFVAQANGVGAFSGVGNSGSSSSGNIPNAVAAADAAGVDVIASALDRSSPLPPIDEAGRQQQQQCDQQQQHPQQQQQHPQQQQQQGPLPTLQRANSDDYIVRMGSLRYNNSSGGGAAAPTTSSSSSVTQLHLEATATETYSAVCTACTAPLSPAAAAAVQTGSCDTPAAPPPSAPYDNPFAATAAASTCTPFAAAAAGAAAPPADPFAAAAVASRGETVGLRHCMATFFLREEITWDCPREKALWKESRRVSLSGAEAANQAAAAAAGNAASGSSSSNTTAAAQGAVRSQAIRINSTAAVDVQPDDGCPIYKQVSFSDQHPQVILVPGSIEQRGTDLQAALAGRKPFTRALTWKGAALLLTAQLRQSSSSSSRLDFGLLPQQQQQECSNTAHEVAKTEQDAGAYVTRVLELGLKAAGEGNAAAAAVLPAGKAVQLGSVQLPSLEGGPAEHQASLLPTWAQLVLNCMADLVLYEGGVPGLQAMLAGQLAVLPHSSSEFAAAPHTAQYLEAACDEREWKVRGQLPAAKGAAAAAAADDGSADNDSAVAVADSDAAAAPAASFGGAAAAADAASSSSSSNPCVGGYWEYPAADEDVELNQQQQQQPSGSPSSSSSNSRQLTEQTQVLRQPEQTSTDCAADADATAAEDDGLFDMDDESDGNNSENDEQQEQGVAVLPTQAWEGNTDIDSLTTVAAPAAASAKSAGDGVAGDCNCGSSCTALSSRDSDNSTRGSSMFRKVHVQEVQEHPAATATNCSSSSKPLDILPPTQALAAAAADTAAASPAGGTPSSLRRSSLRRKSLTFNRTAHKAYRIYLAPQVLVLHLKRFQHDGKGRMQKLDTPVKFDFEINLAPFMATAATTAGAAAVDAPAATTGGAAGSAGSCTSAVSTESAAAAAAVGAPAGATGVDESDSSAGCGGGPISWQQAAADSSSLIYDLVGVVVHMGTMRGGHYVAYVKRSTQPQQQQQQQLPGDGSSGTGPSAGSSNSKDADSGSSKQLGSSGGTGSTGGGMFSSLVGAGKSAAAAAAATQWYYVSDTSVKAVSKSEVANAQAYMLMYVRR